MCNTSACRIGFACRNATAVLGDDRRSWACNVTHGDFVHDGVHSTFLDPIERPLIDFMDGLGLEKPRKLYPYFWNVNGQPTPHSRSRDNLGTIGPLAVILDLLTGDVTFGMDKKRIGGVMVNLREWIKKEKEMHREGRNDYEEIRFYPAFCARNLTAKTALFGTCNSRYQVFETRHFLDFADQYAAHKVALSSFAIRPTSGMLAFL